MKSESIELITQYKDGTEIKENAVKIFARKKSLTRNEFYSAYGVGLNPSYILLCIHLNINLQMLVLTEQLTFDMLEDYLR